MNESTQETMLQRLARLEQESRRWKAFGIGAIALLGLVVLLGASAVKPTKSSHEIHATRFIVVDKDGNKRGQLGAGEDGTVGLMLHDRTETGGARLSMEPDGTVFLTFFDPAGKGRLSMRVQASGLSLMGLHDQAGTARLLLGMEPDGTPNVGFRDGGGTPRAAMRVQGDGLSTFGFADQRGSPRMTWGMTPEGTANLVFTNQAGKVFWKAP